MSLTTFEGNQPTLNEAIRNGSTSVLEPELETWVQRTCYIADSKLI